MAERTNRTPRHTRRGGACFGGKGREGRSQWERAAAAPGSDAAPGSGPGSGSGPARPRHGGLGALQRPEPGPGAPPQGRPVRLCPGRGHAELREGLRDPEPPPAAGGSSEPGPQIAAPGGLGRGAGGGPALAAPPRPRAEVLPHPVPPEPRPVPRLRQRAVGREERAPARPRHPQVEPEVLQVLPVCAGGEPEPGRLRAAGAAGARRGRRLAREEPGEAAPGRAAAAAAPAPAAAPGAPGQPPAAAGPAAERLRPGDPAGAAGAVAQRAGPGGAVRPGLLRALHPHHPAPLAQAQAVAVPLSWESRSRDAPAHPDPVVPRRTSGVGSRGGIGSFFPSAFAAAPRGERLGLEALDHQGLLSGFGGDWDRPSVPAGLSNPPRDNFPAF